MKRIVCLGVLILARCMATDEQTQTPVRYPLRSQSATRVHRATPPRPEARHVRSRVHRTAEEQNFNRLNRRNAQDLDRRIHWAYDARDGVRLRDLATLARRFAHDAQSTGNAAFANSIYFHRKFNRLAERAEEFMRRLDQGDTIRPVPFDINR